MVCVFVCVTSQLLLWDSYGSLDSPSLKLLFLGQSFGKHSPERLFLFEGLRFAVVCLLNHSQGKVSHLS